LCGAEGSPDPATERWLREETAVARGVEISQMQRRDIAQVVGLWNEAVQAQGQGYERHVQSAERLGRIVGDPNFLAAGALTARSAGELVGFALGYVQTVDFLGAGKLARVAGRLAAVAVRPDKWRQGIGRRLSSSVESVLAEHGKSEVSLPVYHRMPIALIRGIHIDSGPYCFLKACGYEDIGHGLVFYNDIEHFEVQDWVVERQKRLREEGISFRWYQSRDRLDLLEFMAHEFAGAWHTIVETAVSGPSLPEILLALTSDRIGGFIGPFDVGERGRFYFSTDARIGWGSFGSPGVASAFQQRGIGTVLWHLGLDHLRRSGAEFTEYGTGLDNPAQQLYFHSGARLIEISCEDMRKRL
jgi:ribosomal protein S18 acetylase RimI-like enzyme